MDRNSNLYTIIYAAIMVIVVAVVLALASSLLKERQQRNIELERKQMILTSVHLGEVADKATSKEDYIEQEYAKYITDTSIVAGEKELELYICREREEYYIIPLRGAGLWGPVWGYVSIKSDFNTIYGAVFDHEGETPGLGAEIATFPFYSQFNEKKLFDSDGEFISVKVAKGGGSADKPHQVDAISGGTITSEAIEEMLYKCVEEYLPFFVETSQNR